MSRAVFALALSLFLAACATKPDNIASSSVSTLQYQDYDCKQIALELERVERKVNALYHNLDKKAGGDAAQMGLGLVLFWPALFFLEGGDGPDAAEYARLKGEMEALETVSIHKKCDIRFPEPPKKTEEPKNSAKKEFNR